jgi:carbon storage regulator
MLVLSRKNGEALRIGSHIEVRVLAVHGGQVRLGIDAPAEVTVHREEVYQRIAEANRESTRGDPTELRLDAAVDGVRCVREAEEE